MVPGSTTISGRVAQLGEQRLCKPKVEGSSPFTVHQFLGGG